MFQFLKFGAPFAALSGSLTYLAKSTKLHPHTFLSFEEHCRMNNYLVSKYNVTTPDGYILSLFRLNKRNTVGEPVLLVHGLSGTSDTFIINLNTKPLGFRLVDAGYDVWFANTRGNYYSRRHVYLDPDKNPEYWDWTSEAIACNDIPATVNYVQQATGRSKISYIGHSQGGCVMLCILAKFPNLAKNFNLVVCLTAPGPRITNGVTSLGFFTHEISQAVFKFLGTQLLMDKTSETLCYIPAMFPEPFYEFYKDVYDPKIHNDSMEWISVYARRVSGGTSRKNVEFVGQIARAGRLDNLSRFDYGQEFNTLIYGVEKPPEIDFSKIRAKLAIIGGKYDRLVTPSDLEALRERLDKDSLVYFNNDFPVDHGGVLLSGYTKHYDVILDLLKEHSSNEAENKRIE